MSYRLAFGLLLACVTCLAADETPTPSQDMPTSPAAVAAQRKYDAAAEKAMRTYRQSMLAADKELDAGLAGTLKSAMAANNLSEANRINAQRQLCSDRIKNAREMSPQGPSRSTAFTIVSARYGTEANSVDVTQFVAKCVKGGSLDLPERVDLASGKDPAPDHPKSVFLEIEVGGRRLGLIFRDYRFRLQVLPSAN